MSGSWLGDTSVGEAHAEIVTASVATMRVVLSVFGLASGELRLTAGQLKAAYICGVIGAYAGLAGGVYSALVDLPGPASNPGFAPPMPQAAIFFAILAIVIPTILISFGLAVYGMRGSAPE